MIYWRDFDMTKNSIQILVLITLILLFFIHQEEVAYVIGSAVDILFAHLG